MNAILMHMMNRFTTNKVDIANQDASIASELATFYGAKSPPDYAILHGVQIPVNVSQDALETFNKAHGKSAKAAGNMYIHESATGIGSTFMPDRNGYAVSRNASGTNFGGITKYGPNNLIEKVVGRDNLGEILSDPGALTSFVNTYQQVKKSKTRGQNEGGTTLERVIRGDKTFQNIIWTAGGTNSMDAQTDLLLNNIGWDNNTKTYNQSLYNKLGPYDRTLIDAKFDYLKIQKNIDASPKVEKK